MDTCLVLQVVIMLIYVHADQCPCCYKGFSDFSKFWVLMQTVKPQMWLCLFLAASSFCDSRLGFSYHTYIIFSEVHTNCTYWHSL